MHPPKTYLLGSRCVLDIPFLTAYIVTCCSTTAEKYLFRWERRKKNLHIYIYTYTYLYIYICMYVHIYRHISIYTYTYVHIYIYTYIHVYIYTYIHTYIYIYIYTYPHMHTHIYTHIHIYIYTNTHTNTYAMYMYMYMHMCMYRYIYIYCTCIWLLYCELRRSLKFKHVKNGHGTVATCKVWIYCSCLYLCLMQHFTTESETCSLVLFSRCFWRNSCQEVVEFKTQVVLFVFQRWHPFLEQYCTFCRSLWMVLPTLSVLHPLKRTQ